MQKIVKWLKTRQSMNRGLDLSQTNVFSGAFAKIVKPFIRHNCQNSSHSKFSGFKALSIATVALTLASSCTYKSPAVETPVPTEEGVSKSFFVETKIDPKTNQAVNVPKTFLCGWASEMETGWSAEMSYTNNVMVPEHCNLAFEVTEHQLVGKLINPSFATDPTRWEIVLTIPISSHYYLENEKDSAGRDTKKVIKNSNRSHWSARPQMDLNFQGINLNYKWGSWFSRWFGGGAGNINVEKIEWDTTGGFLGFTINQGSYESHYNRIRFNILAFEHNPNFKKTPFNDQNYKRMNVLHIIGEKVNGLYQILHAAHWDIQKTHEIRLWKFPEAYKSIAKEVVNDWNEHLKKTGLSQVAEGPFVVSDKEAEHAFDLRYPTIAWIADEKISSYSALGVGMALADVKNGEIKWGMITLYGGMIESYIKAFSSNSSDSTTTGKIAAQFFNQKTMPQNLDMPDGIKQMALTSRLTMSQSQSEVMAKVFAESMIKNNKTKKDASGKSTSPSAAKSPEELELPKNLQTIFGDMIKVSQNQVDQAKLQTANQSYADLIKQSIFGSADISNQDTPEMSNGKELQKPTSKNARAELIQKYSSPQFCQGRTFADVAAGWAQARADMKGGLVEDKRVLIHVIKELITHEYGHFLGLGHQFKENILPAKDSVPEKYYSALAKRASADNGFNNYSSVMGYRNPRTEFSDQENILPGPQDDLVLRFLYNQQYSTFKSGDADFTFQTVPANGIIPDQAPEKPEMKTTYFPQCNDVDASTSMDPFCNRFDRGYSATTIVQNYFSDLNDTLTQNTFAFTDARGGCAECAEGRLWYKSMTTMARTRLFYDYMRLYFKNEIDQIRTDEDALMEFSKACNPGDSDKSYEIRSTVLRDIFAQKPQFKELCKANSIVLNEIKNLVGKKGTDFTKKDISNRFAPGGMDGGDTDRDWSRFTGSWTEMSVLPLKISAMYALTTGVPWMSEYGMWGVPLFDDPNYKFSYSSLYPKEFTEVIAENVTKNLHFASLGQEERTSMGRSIMSMGWFNYMSQAGHNDAGLFPPQYIEKIRSQQKFDFGVVALILKGRVKENNPNYVDSFAGSVYDLSTSKETPLTNAYLLPGGVVMADASNMFLYPITRFTPFNDTDGYVIAYKLDYFRDHTDPLSDFSVKTGLKSLHDNLVKACVMGTDGTNNGLAQFFSNTVPEFKGFKMAQGLAREESKRKEFFDSIDQAYTDYYSYRKFSSAPKAETCRESIRGLGLIMSSAAVMNGFWLPEVIDYIQK